MHHLARLWPFSAGLSGGAIWPLWLVCPRYEPPPWRSWHPASPQSSHRLHGPIEHGLGVLGLAGPPRQREHDERKRQLLPHGFLPANGAGRSTRALMIVLSRPPAFSPNEAFPTFA